MGLKVIDGTPTAISKFIRENEMDKQQYECKCGAKFNSMEELLSHYRLIKHHTYKLLGTKLNLSIG